MRAAKQKRPSLIGSGSLDEDVARVQADLGVIGEEGAAAAALGGHGAPTPHNTSTPLSTRRRDGDFAPAIGSLVEVNFSGLGRWFQGRVASTSAGNKLVVTFFTGQKAAVSTKLCRALPSSARMLMQAAMGRDGSAVLRAMEAKPDDAHVSV
jgi:hypothetical protein